MLSGDYSPGHFSVPSVLGAQVNQIDSAGSSFPAATVRLAIKWFKKNKTAYQVGDTKGKRHMKLVFNNSSMNDVELMAGPHPETLGKKKH